MKNQRNSNLLTKMAITTTILLLMGNNSYGIPLSNEADTTSADAEKRAMPLNNIRISGGYTYVTSKLYDQSGGTISNPSGYGLSISYTRLWKTKGSTLERPRYGGVTITAQTKQAHSGYDIMTNLVGIGYTWAQKTNKGFAWHYTLGIAYTHTNDIDCYIDNSGFGIFGMAGFDYMLTKHFGIGAFVNPTLCFFSQSKPNDYTINTNVFTGVAHYDIQVAASWHF